MDTSRIKEHMKVVGSDGRHVGTVDCVKDEKVILAKARSDVAGEASRDSGRLGNQDSGERGAAQ